MHYKKKVGLTEMLDHFDEIGVPVNKESLRSRSKTRRGIADLESAQDRNAAAILNSEDEDDMVVEDDKLAAAEAETRGRKRRRDRSVNPDDFMDVDDEEAGSQAGQKKRNLTPAQRTVSAQKIIRSKT